MKLLNRLQGIAGILLLIGIAAPAAAQQPGYGPSINLETAKKIAAGAEAEIRKNGWQMAIAIVDTHGFPVYFQLGDDTQSASGNIALQKARTAVMWRRPTKAQALRPKEKTITAGPCAKPGVEARSFR